LTFVHVDLSTDGCFVLAHTARAVADPANAVLSQHSFVGGFTFASTAVSLFYEVMRWEKALLFRGKFP